MSPSGSYQALRLGDVETDDVSATESEDIGLCQSAGTCSGRGEDKVVVRRDKKGVALTDKRVNSARYGHDGSANVIGGGRGREGREGDTDRLCEQEAGGELGSGACPHRGVDSDLEAAQTSVRTYTQTHTQTHTQTPAHTVTQRGFRKIATAASELSIALRERPPCVALSRAILSAVFRTRLPLETCWLIFSFCVSPTAVKRVLRPLVAVAPYPQNRSALLAFRQPLAYVSGVVERGNDVGFLHVANGHVAEDQNRRPSCGGMGVTMGLLNEACWSLNQIRETLLLTHLSSHPTSKNE